MSSSVLGLGAATLGAAAMSLPSLNKKGKQKGSDSATPSAEDYLNSYMSLIWGGYKGSDKEKIDATFGGPLRSVSGDFYYGEAPKKVPQGAVVLRGEDINVQSRGVNEGMYSRKIPTYQVVQMQPAQQTPQLRLDLSQGGRVDKLNRADINYALEQGATLKQVRQAAKAQDLNVSKRAENILQKQTAPQQQAPQQQAPQQQEPQLRLNLSQGGGRVDKLNTADINYAMEQGASAKQIRQAVKSQDIKMSAKAKSLLQKAKKNK